VPGSSSAVRSADFVSGAYSLAQVPPERWPEVAVVGRSNVGKSSLINCLLGSSSLAKVSKHPGAPPAAVAAAAASAVVLHSTASNSEQPQELA
jgi:GTP-binding protein EngB required for normal cell division